MIKKIFPSISSGALVGRNSTLLTQIDYPSPRKQHHLHSAAADGLEKTRGQRRCEHTPRGRDPEKHVARQSAYTISSRSLWRWWEVAVCGSAGLSRCHWRSEHGGEGWVTARVMGWGDSCPGRGGGETRELWAGREKKHMLAGEEPALWWPPSSARFEPGGGGK